MTEDIISKAITSLKALLKEESKYNSLFIELDKAAKTRTGKESRVIKSVVGRFFTNSKSIKSMITDLSAIPSGTLNEEEDESR